MQNNEEKKTEDVTGPPDQFDGRDLLKSYMHYRNYSSSDSIKDYKNKRKCIEFGKELLPSFIDPDEKDKDQIKKNKKEQETTDKLYALACKVLTTEIPGKRTITYKYIDDKHYVYEIVATDGDADDCQAVKEELETVKNDFKDQQHEQHMGVLEEIDNKVFHELVRCKIVKKQKPTIGDILDKRIEKRYKKGDS